MGKKQIRQLARALRKDNREIAKILKRMKKAVASMESQIQEV